MKIDRLLGELSVLAGTDKTTVQELAERFEVSRRTIFRDMETLNQAGIPIYAMAGSGGGIALVEGYKVDQKVLSEEDTRNLYIALDSLRSIGQRVDITNLMAKLIPQQETEIFPESIYLISLSAWFSDELLQNKLETLASGIREKRCVFTEYISSSGRRKRLIEPHKLIFKHKDWYVYAFCQERIDFRLFKLKRMITCELTDSIFTPHKIEKPEFPQNPGNSKISTSYFEGSEKVILEYSLSDEYAITQKIDAALLEADLSKDEKTGRICLYLEDLQIAEQLVFELFGKMKVIEPLALIEKINTRLEKER